MWFYVLRRESSPRSSMVGRRKGKWIEIFICLHHSKPISFSIDKAEILMKMNVFGGQTVKPLTT